MTTVAGLLVFQDVIKICYDCHLWPYISLALMSGYGLLCECSTPLLLIWWYVSQIRAQFFLDYICTFWSTPSIWRNDSTIPPLLQFWAKKILFFFGFTCILIFFYQIFTCVNKNTVKKFCKWQSTAWFSFPMLYRWAKDSIVVSPNST